MQTDLRGQLVTQVPSGFALTDEPIAFASPVEQAAGSGLMTVAVTVDAAEQISPDLIDQIRNAASGNSIQLIACRTHLGRRGATAFRNPHATCTVNVGFGNRSYQFNRNRK